MQPLRMVERTRVFTPLGIRFWDAAFDVPVQRPLVVHAWLRQASHRPVRAVRTPGGIYAFHGLPGQVGVRQEDTPPDLEYCINVHDPAGQYLDVAFSVTLPLAYRGEFLSAAPGSMPAAAGRAYLFSAPGRPVPPGAVAVRADLEDAVTGGPASWAVLRAGIAGREATAIADGRGRVLLLAPQPEADRLGLGSPPGLAQGEPGTQEWPVTLRVEYQPEVLRYPFAAASHLPAAWRETPSLRSVLFEQAPALVTERAGDAPVDEWTADIRYGVELQLRSRDATDSPESSLRVTPGVSIP